MHNIICLLRCTSRRHAEKCSRKFNTSYSWIEYENKNGKGIGDLLEGVFASIHTDFYRESITSSDLNVISEIINPGVLIICR